MAEKQTISLAEQVNLLFAEITDSEGHPYTAKYVAECAAVSQAAITHIRNGRTPNPGIEIVKKLAHFFGVPLSYFDALTEEACMNVIHQRYAPQEQSEVLTRIALRSRQLSPAAQADILRMVEYVRQAERRLEKNQDNQEKD